MMPIYEYTCGDCQFTFDTLRPMDDADSPIDCSQCGGLNTSRSLSLFFTQVSGGTTAAGAAGSCACATSGGCGCRS